MTNLSWLHEPLPSGRRALYFLISPKRLPKLQYEVSTTKQAVPLAAAIMRPQQLLYALLSTWQELKGVFSQSNQYTSLSPIFGLFTSSLLGHHGALSTDAQHAALLNSIASHVHDYDDTHLDTIIHPTGPIASALLAATELRSHPPPLLSNPQPDSTKITGRQFLLALTAGIEASCKLGLAVWPNHYDVGWHITSTTGSIGAAVAVSNILDLSLEKTVQAIGIAATQVTGPREMFGSHTKSLHPGRAAQNGLLAALLAETSSVVVRAGWRPREAGRMWSV